MRNPWMSSLALSLGVLISAARAANNPAGPAAQLDPPVAPPAAFATRAASPAAALDRPLPLTEPTPLMDSQVRPTAYNDTSANQGGADLLMPRPMPPGPRPPEANAPADPPVNLHGWRRAPDPTAPPPPPVATGGPPEVVPPPQPGTSSPPWSVLGDGYPGGCPGGCATPGSAPCNPGCCGTCRDGGCGCPSGCCFDNRFYASAEYLLWWIRGSPLPPLVTAGSAGDVIPGALGLPGTRVLFGGNSVGDGPLSGGRFFVGYWLNDGHTLGAEIGGFFLGDSVTSFNATSLGAGGLPSNIILTRPFINALTGTETTELVAAPNVLAGAISVQDRIRLWGYEANLRSNLCCGRNWFVDGLAGFRALGLDDTLNITETLQVIGGTGGSFVVNDRFAVQNRFYGAQLGTYAEYRHGPWSIGLTSKLAMGPTQQIVTISGSTLTTDASGTHLAAGGLLAQTSNIGTFTRDHFTVVPEVGINLGYQVTPRLRAFVGYNFLYWSSVVRPGQQTDRTVNPNLLPPAIPGGPARPAFSFNSTDFWAQGITFGLLFRY